MCHYSSPATRITLRVYDLHAERTFLGVRMELPNGTFADRLVTLVPVNGVAFASVDLTPPVSFAGAERMSIRANGGDAARLCRD